MKRSLIDDCNGESNDAFVGRMRAQCSEIRRYRQELIRSEGRHLSQDEAAMEWIERYAESFAREHDDR